MHRSVCPRASDLKIGRYLLSGHVLMGWVYPSLLAQASDPGPTRRQSREYSTPKACTLLTEEGAGKPL